VVDGLMCLQPPDEKDSSEEEEFDEETFWGML
jgi:uncharacterized pyridoxal phosphate-containing UPF0001 family protein